MPRTNGTGNVFLTNDEILKRSMVLLKNNLVALRTVNRDTEKAFTGKIGDTISVRKPQRIKSASGRALVKQPLVQETVPLKVQYQEHVGFEITQNDRTLSLDAFSNKTLDSAMSQLAHKVDRSILVAASQQFFFGSGTAGTAIDTDNFADASAYMDMVGVPQDNMRYAMVHPLDASSIQKDVKKLANEAIVKSAIERKYLGDLSSFHAYDTAQMPVHTVGDYSGTPLVAGGGQTGKTLVTDGWGTSISGALHVGDCFTIAGVYEVNPQTYESTGRLQRFVVTDELDTDGAGGATVSISPEINDGTLTAVDGDGNTVSRAAYQNVTAAPADNAAITVIGTAGTTYRQTLAYHRDAISFATVQLEIPESATVAKRYTDAQTGLSMLMTQDFGIENLDEITRIDILWAVDSLYPELGHRVWSATHGM